MTSSVRATELIPARSLVWLGTGVSLAVIPLAWFLPVWLPLWTLVMAGWRIRAAWKQTGTPPTAIRLLLFLSGVPLVAFSYGTILSVDAAVALLCLLIGLKILEIRTLRDYLVAVFVGFFVLLSVFFYDQSLSLILYGLAPSIMLLAGASQATSGRRTPMPGKLAFHTALHLLALAAPVTLVLFIFFPRFSGAFALRVGPANEARTGMSDEVHPGSINTLALSQDVAFRATFRGDLPPYSQLYWRGIVLTHCEGLTWKRSRPRFAPNWLSPRSSGLIYQEISIEPHYNRWLFALDRPVLIFGEDHMFHDQTIGSDRRVIRQRKYRVASAPHFSAQTLSERERRETLQANFTPSPRIEMLVKTWQAETGGDASKMIDAALAFFRDGFLYTLQPGPYEGEFGLDKFLFAQKRGFCEHYAASFATLLRLAGIPTRLVAGYQGGTLNRQGGFVTVRQSDAHAWVEVWIEGEGWRRVDPTESVAPDRLEFGMETFARTTDGDADLETRRLRLLSQTGWTQQFAQGIKEIWDNINHQWEQFVLDFNEEQQKAFARSLGIPNGMEQQALIGLLIAGLSLAAGLVLCLIFRQRSRPDPLTSAALQFFALLEPLAGPRKPSEPITTFASRAAEHLDNETAAVVRQHARAHAEARYGAKKPDLVQVRTSLHRLRALLRRTAATQPSGRQHPPTGGAQSM
jgi:transglutaminase-like putative cysteine protease